MSRCIGTPRRRKTQRKLLVCVGYAAIRLRCIKLSREQRESLAEQHPEISLVLPESLRCQEIAAYLALPEGVRERLDKGEQGRWVEIPLSKDKLMRLVQQRVRGITPEQLRGAVFWLEKDQQGAERLMFTGAFSTETSRR